ncbi:MAG TPA: ATP-binding protein [Burkholderiaceae bacterium]|nr:ATP-binding protein [Burkholderiaceae bacterium]
MTAVPLPAAPSPTLGSRVRRVLPWAALVLLLLVAQSLLVALTIDYEAGRKQEQVEAVSGAAAAQLRHNVGTRLQELQALLWSEVSSAQWQRDAAQLLRAHPELLRIERRDADGRIRDATDTAQQPPLFTRIPRAGLSLDSELACVSARRNLTPSLSRSYFVPRDDGLGIEVIDACVPVTRRGQLDGTLVATIGLSALLDGAITAEQARLHELSLVEGDGTRLARAGLPRGLGVFVAERPVDLPGLTLQLRVDSTATRPQLIPNLAIALVLGLSLALFGVVLLLARDVRRRARAETQLAEALALRKAMEDSLVTGLRARGLDGRLGYVNPAFCAMVGYSADELLGAYPPPYWPPEMRDEYAQRQARRLDAGQSVADAREGYETLFQRKSGERFPVMIYEAPLVDGSGRHTGWMSAVVDVSAQRRVEELSRQQQERLQAAARLATVGEMASLLSHELNQPLSAIASYASGSLNLLQQPDAQTPGQLQQAIARIAEQAERAGRVIKSVHNFVRRREQAHEVISTERLIDAVLPLVRLQARKSGTRIAIDVPHPSPRVKCDRTMVEQVLLNLARNGIQAMEEATPLPARVLTLRVRSAQPRWVAFSVIDHGPGIAPDVAQRLFTPFFTTRHEGMGLGLSLCRTVIEQHGGALDFGVIPATASQPAGTEFRFTLPADSKLEQRA